MKFSADLDPLLDGCWLEDTTNTMVMQSTKIGVPAIQLELPFTMRYTCSSDSTFIKRIADIIGKLYKGTITEYWNTYNLWRSVKSNSKITEGITV